MRICEQPESVSKLPRSFDLRFRVLDRAQPVKIKGTSEAQQLMAATNESADSRQLANRRNRGGGSTAYPFRHPPAANEVGASQLKTPSGFRE